MDLVRFNYHGISPRVSEAQDVQKAQDVNDRSREQRFRSEPMWTPWTGCGPDVDALKDVPGVAHSK